MGRKVSPTKVRMRFRRSRLLRRNHLHSQLTEILSRFTACRLEDLVSQDDIVTSITNLIDSDNLPHLLLYGPPGTGKTSTIIAAAKRMYGSSKAYSSMTLELNASDARGIDVRVCPDPQSTPIVRQLILSFDPFDSHSLGCSQRSQRICWNQTSFFHGRETNHSRRGTFVPALLSCAPTRVLSFDPHSLLG